MTTVVIGAGPAGLATSQQLSARGIEHIVLERGDVGQSWANTYESLTLHTGKHMSSLPGMRFGRNVPLFVPRDRFLDYLGEYRQRFAVPVETHCNVTRMTRDGASWLLETTRGEIRAAAVVVATGIMANPRIPHIPGRERFRGTIRHSVTYRRPAEMSGKRVLVIGAGNSAAEIATELARAGVDTTIAIRSGANVVPLHLAGVPIQYVGYIVRKFPRIVQTLMVGGMRRLTDLRFGAPPIPRPSHGPFESQPLIGLKILEMIRSGALKMRGGIEEITEEGVRFSGGIEEPFDEILLATGFSAAIDFLGHSAQRDAKGFGMRRDRVVSAENPNLFFVGHNYDSTGGLFNIRRDAPLAAEQVRAALRRT